MLSLILTRVTLASAQRVQAIVDCAPSFLFKTEGVGKDPTYASRDLKHLPPGCSFEQKHSLIIQHDNVDIGFADLVADFPKKGTSFIGLLLLKESHQRSGLGTAAYKHLEQYARNELGALNLRLAFNETNLVGPFWEKMGYRPTGESGVHKGVAKDSRVVLMTKTLED